jgi:hypothetical protein
MSANAAAILIGLVYLAAGYGILAAVQALPSTGRRAIAAVGLAYIAGVAGTLILCIALVCMGVAIHATTFSAVGLLIGIVGAAVGVARAGGRPLSSIRRPGRWFTPGSTLTTIRGGTSMIRLSQSWPSIFVAGVLLVFFVLGYRLALVTPLAAWDSWSIWARKAVILLDFGHLPAGLFTSPSYRFMHPDYPLLVPMMESVWFRFVSGADTQTLHVQFWLLFAASLGASAYISARLTPSVVWAPLVGFIAVTPAIYAQLTTQYADIPMCLFLLPGLLLVGDWIGSRRSSSLILATLLLAAAANTKNEGLTAAASAITAGTIVTLSSRSMFGRRRDLTLVLLGIAGFLVAVAPWRLWLAAHNIGGDMPIGKGLDPHYLSSRTARLSPTFTALYHQLTSQSVWHYLLPLGLALVLARLIPRHSRALASFYGLTGIFVFASIVWAYWINANPIQWYLATSANRTVDGVMFVAAAGLLGLAGAGRQERTDARFQRTQAPVEVRTTAPADLVAPTGEPLTTPRPAGDD